MTGERDIDVLDATKSQRSSGDEEQRRFWNRWNEENRAHQSNEISRRQSENVIQWLEDIGRKDLRIIEVGCGAAWLTPSLTPFGTVTGTDLSDELLAKAQVRHPDIKFIAGDFMRLDFGGEPYDVAVSLEVLSHVPDQQAFVAKIAGLLKPGGHLMLATQNRPVLERYNRIPPPSAGQLRRWVDAAELEALLTGHFDLLKLYSVTPRADHGLMRIATSHKINVAIDALVGTRFRDFLERRGLGWTLMAHARKRQ
jgi:2-polyprenyl-3-methyl-5-hydroxy-6-metoxy-1,4-benzoquinol methylase